MVVDNLTVRTVNANKNWRKYVANKRTYDAHKHLMPMQQQQTTNNYSARQMLGTNTHVFNICEREV